MATESLSEAIYKTINGSGNTTIFPEMSGFTGSSETCSNLTEKAPRPPNRKKNDEELADLTVKIKELEDAKQKSSEQLRLAREQVNCFRDRRDQISGQKYDVDEKLNVINKSVEVKKDVLQRLKAAFVVISEDKLDDQVSILKLNHLKYVKFYGLRLPRLNTYLRLVWLNIVTPLQILLPE